MGEVWMAQRSAMGGAAKTVAVKTLLPQRANDPLSRKMFVDEARLSMLLSNSNIVQVFDVGEAQDGTCYMAMEWVEGLNLSELCERLAARGEALPLAIAAFVIGEVLKALAYAHELVVNAERRTIVHRDVSPHNVMLSVAGEVKLMDFGIARLASEETSGVHVKGKLRYMPPEQLRGDTRGPKLDLFAVGAILHELLEGKKFRGGVVDEDRLFGMILDGDVPPLSCKERIPFELEALVDGLLGAKPDQRFASARVAYRVLAQWPGYRDAKFELEDLVRQFVRPEREVTATLMLPIDAQTPQRGVVLGDGSQTDRTTRMDSSDLWTQSTSTARTKILVSSAVDAGPSDGHGRRLLAIALATIGVGCGIVAAGTLRGWWTHDEAVLTRDPEPQPSSMPNVDGPIDGGEVDDIQEIPLPDVETPSSPSERGRLSEVMPEPNVAEPPELATPDNKPAAVKPKPTKGAPKPAPAPEQDTSEVPPGQPTKTYHPDLKNPFE